MYLKINLVNIILFWFIEQNMGLNVPHTERTYGNADGLLTTTGILKSRNSLLNYIKRNKREITSSIGTVVEMVFSSWLDWSRNINSDECSYRIHHWKYGNRVYHFEAYKAFDFNFKSCNGNGECTSN